MAKQSAASVQDAALALLNTRAERLLYDFGKGLCQGSLAPTCSFFPVSHDRIPIIQTVSGLLATGTEGRPS